MVCRGRIIIAGLRVVTAQDLERVANAVFVGVLQAVVVAIIGWFRKGAAAVFFCGLC
jgi:hypothetical protein